MTYDKANDRFYYDGKRVRRFIDIKISNGESLSSGKFKGSMMSRNDEYGEINIETVRDFTVLDENGYGKLTGVISGRKSLDSRAIRFACRYEKGHDI